MSRIVDVPTLGPVNTQEQGEADLEDIQHDFDAGRRPLVLHDAELGRNVGVVGIQDAGIDCTGEVPVELCRQGSANRSSSWKAVVTGDLAHIIDLAHGVDE